MAVSLKQDQLYIDGEFVDPATAEWFGSTDPYTGGEWVEIPAGGPADVDAAVRAAHAAVYDPDSEWAQLSPTERGQYLDDLADALEDHAERHAEMDVRDNGKPIREMRSQHESIPEYYRFYAGLADKIRGATITPDDPTKKVFTEREPIGVVGAITPWNSPLMLAAWKIAPALAAGNAVVLKPDEKTSTSALSFAAVVDDVGIPDGVINVVSGRGAEAGQALVEHGLVDKVSFTGGTETGSHIASEAGAHLKPTTMELGGKSPNIVFPDATLDNAVNGALNGIFSSVGQSCSAGSRLLLHEDIHDDFVDELCGLAADIELGDPKDPATEMGPIASREQFEKVSKYVDLGRQSEARLVHGGEPPTEDLGSDLFLQPTIFANVSNSSRIAQDEIFGPVLSVIEFADEEEAIEIANDTEYGLTAGIWTEDIRRAHRVAERIRAGRVWINNYRNSGVVAPQGGYKNSGWGVENGIEVVEEYLKTKSIWLEMDSTTENKFGPN
jgi:aldehyde dehydrogenase (NAD+)